MTFICGWNARKDIKLLWPVESTRQVEREESQSIIIPITARKKNLLE